MDKYLDTTTRQPAQWRADDDDDLDDDDDDVGDDQTCQPALGRAADVEFSSDGRTTAAEPRRTWTAS